MITRFRRPWAAALAPLLLSGLLVSACSSGSSTSTTTGAQATSSTQQSTAPAQTGPTLAALIASVRTQITGTAASDLSVEGVANVTCTPPSVWRRGATFTCVAYNSSGDQVGQYDGTVSADVDRTPRWNGLWSAR